MVRFGLVEVEPRPLKDRRSESRGWLMKKAKRTPWGAAVAWAVFERLISTAENEFDVEFYHLPEELDQGFFQPAFQPFFPEYQRAFSSPQAVTWPGVYVFRATVEPRYHGSIGVWRDLAVPGPISLYELATAVLDAFEFEDHEHLYEFRFKDRSGKPRVFFHPGTAEGPYSDEITVEESCFLEKQTIKFRFDYGDDWRFLLRLERIDPPEKKLKHIKLIGSDGKAPKHYTNWD